MTRARDLASGLAGVRPFAMASGTLTPANNGATVTLPAGRFSATPIITFTVAGSSNYPIVTQASKSSSSFSFYATNGATGAASGINGASLDWTAIQMTSGSASG